MGLGFTLVLVLLGALRELIGTGQLFANMQLLLPFAENWRITIIPDYRGFLLAILPPGAFIFLGLLIALKNVIDTRIEARRVANSVPVTTGSKRVRVTQA